MKLYNTPRAPNPRRVTMFLAEKGVAIDLVEVSIMKGEHRKPDYRAKNPLGLVPTLELDDGVCITETVAICRYIEGLHPEPNLMGRDALELAQIDMWQRIAEQQVLWTVAQCFRHSHPAMAELETQIAEWGALNRRRAEKGLRFLDKRLKGRDWLAADRLTIADITAFIGVQFGKLPKIAIPDDCADLKRWHDAIAARPSAAM